MTPPGGDPNCSFFEWTILRLGWAFRGLYWFLIEPQNAWIHLPAAALTIVFGIWLGIDRMEWCLVIFAFGIVLTAEGLNSALESLADAVHPTEHPLVGRAKDVAAGAVLYASFVAAAIALFVFGPKLWGLLG